MADKPSSRDKIEQKKGDLSTPLSIRFRRKDPNAQYYADAWANLTPDQKQFIIRDGIDRELEDNPEIVRRKIEEEHRRHIDTIKDLEERLKVLERQAAIRQAKEEADRKEWERCNAFLRYDVASNYDEYHSNASIRPLLESVMQKVFTQDERFDVRDGKFKMDEPTGERPLCNLDVKAEHRLINNCITRNDLDTAQKHILDLLVGGGATFDEIVRRYGGITL
ncbi:MAG: hypothetical protein FJ149_04980 [Euryarchaeota archaeon]|nr:hypothetical protein [Euryarchaeota archaeon]